MDLTEEIVKKELLTIPVSKFGLNKISIKNITRIKSGRRNYNYIFAIFNKKYILRINQFRDYNHSKTEFLNLKLINKYLINKGNYPVPIILKKKGKFINYPYIIITYLDGKEIVLNKKNIPLLAREVAKFSNLNIREKDFRFLKKSDYNEKLRKLKAKEEFISNFSKMLGKIAIEVRKNIEKLKTKEIVQFYKLMHGDLSEGNILVYNNQIRFIDFERLKIGDPVLDIAKLSFNGDTYADNFEKYKDLFFKEYVKQTGDATIEKRYDFYKHIQIYSWFVSDLKQMIKSKQTNIKLISKDVKLKDLKFSYNYLKKHNFINCDLKDILVLLNL